MNQVERSIKERNIKFPTLLLSLLNILLINTYKDATKRIGIHITL